MPNFVFPAEAGFHLHTPEEWKAEYRLVLYLGIEATACAFV